MRSVYLHDDEVIHVVRRQVQMTQRLPPAASVARLQFDAPGEKYADWSAADFDVKAWVNRELAAAKDDFGAPGAKGDANRDGSLSVVAQQELDGFATTVLEEEGLRDASRIADVGGQTGGKLSSEQLASGLVTRLQSMAAEISGNIDKVGWNAADSRANDGP